MNLCNYAKYLLQGGVLGLVASGVVGIVLYNTYLLFEEKELTVAIGAFIAVPVLTSVLYWMAIKGRRLKKGVEREIRQ